MPKKTAKPASVIAICSASENPALLRTIQVPTEPKSNPITPTAWCHREAAAKQRPPTPAPITNAATIPMAPPVLRFSDETTARRFGEAEPCGPEPEPPVTPVVRPRGGERGSGVGTCLRQDHRSCSV